MAASRDIRFPLNENGKCVSVSVWCGQVKIHIRNFPNGFPTRQGITLDIDEWAKLRSYLREVDEVISKMSSSLQNVTEVTDGARGMADRRDTKNSVDIVHKVDQFLKEMRSQTPKVQCPPLFRREEMRAEEDVQNENRDLMKNKRHKPLKRSLWSTSDATESFGSGIQKLGEKERDNDGQSEKDGRQTNYRGNGVKRTRWSDAAERSQPTDPPRTFGEDLHRKFEGLVLNEQSKNMPDPVND